jgi:prepilin-type processing-associated H-X9-DG protein
MLGWKMYTDDNGDLLPPNDYPYETAYFGINNQEHVRSYSMNSAVGTTWSAFYANGSPALGAPVGGGWLLGQAYTDPQSVYLTYGKGSSFNRPGPANTWVMIDENPISINDASMAVAGAASTAGTYIIDWPSGLHNQAGGIAFADGHSIIQKWKDSRTYTPPQSEVSNPGQGGQGTTAQNPYDPDMLLLSAWTTALVNP